MSSLMYIGHEQIYIFGLPKSCLWDYVISELASSHNRVRETYMH